MAYDTQIIYHNLRDDQMTHFSWDGETYYRTPSGKPKKENRDLIKINIAESEFQEAQKQYNFVFDRNLNL